MNESLTGQCPNHCRFPPVLPRPRPSIFRAFQLTLLDNLSFWPCGQIYVSEVLLQWGAIEWISRGFTAIPMSILLVGHAANRRKRTLGRVLKSFHQEWAGDFLELRKEPVGSVVRLTSTNKQNERTFIGCSSAYGGSPFANSIAVIPKLQISAL